MQPTDPTDSAAGAVRLEHLEAIVDDLSERYRTARPFPHIVLDDFLQPAAARQIVAEYPPVDDPRFLHMKHYNENSQSLNERDLFGTMTRTVIDELQSSRFLRWMSRLTGFRDLVADTDMEGAGLFLSQPGGFLNVHADYTVHQYRRSWARRCNLLLYFNADWEESYGGHLELWDREMRHPVQRVEMAFNRCCIFTTDLSSYHGYPDPIACPDGMSRRALNLYYYTDEKTPPRIQSTDFRARPGDGVKALWIWLDKQAVRTYDLAKRHFGISDRFGSNLMKLLSKLRR